MEGEKRGVQGQLDSCAESFSCIPICDHGYEPCFVFQA